MRQEDNSFFIEHYKPFNGHLINKKFVHESFEFAYEMCFGEGFHRDHRSGGSHERKAGELFANTFQGKVAEFCFYQLTNQKGKDVSYPNLSIHGEGVWDSGDFIVNNKTISIKSMAYFSNLILLETKDWDSKGNYIPGGSKPIDFTIGIRIKPDIKQKFKQKRWLYSEAIPKSELEDFINSLTWKFDVLGLLSQEHFKQIIIKRQIIPKGALLQERIKMDADNYYVEINELQEIKI